MPEASTPRSNVSGYSVEGFAQADVTTLRVSELFRHLPVAVLKARSRAR